MISNFFKLFEENYSKTPDKLALVFYPEAKAISYTFQEVYNSVANIQEQILKKGVKKNSRVLILCEPGPDFYFFSLALIALGATPVFIEAKKEGIFKRIKATSSDFVLFNQNTKKLKYIFPYFWNKKSFIFENKTFALHPIITNRKSNTKKAMLSNMDASDPLLVSFTTGSTGKPKAADRNYFVSFNQHQASLKYWLHDDNDVDLTFFPNILFQNLCSGVTTLIPKMLVKNLEQIPFEKFEDIILKYKVSRISAPPGYLNELCNSIKQPIESVKKVITGGAPVDKRLAKKAIKTFPKSDSNVVYGSTEAEPISFENLKSIAAFDVDGFLVGSPIDEIKVFINNPKSKTLDPSETGEILISGKHVVQRYLNSNIDNEKFKVKDQQGVIWHRTGDIGYFDKNRKLVLLGRKSHKLKTKEGIKYSLSLENAFNLLLPDDKRCAIFQKNNKTFLKIDSLNTDEITKKAHDFMSQLFADYEIEFIPKIPVDFRHHWKIDYESIK